jgi:hypothetical protein
MILKVCSKCKVEKDKTNFQKRNDRPIGLRSWCRDCQRETDRESRKTDKGKKKYRKENWKKNGINITYEEYQEKYERLKGCCEICNDKLPTLCVDHNHTTKEIRGLLCTPCNLAIEHFKEAPDILTNAIKYLNNYGTKHEFNKT